MRILKSPVLWFSALAFVACSARVMGMRHADKLAMHQLDRMFDLTETQEDEYGPLVKTEIERLKKDRLPPVIARVEAYRVAWDKGPTEADALAVVDEYDALRVALADQLSPLAARFLASLSTEQIAHLQEKLDESNEALDDLLALEPEKFAAKAGKNTLKGFDHWLGSLSDDQEAELLKSFPPERTDFERYRKERGTSQRSFVDLVKSHPGEAAIQAKIREWTREPYKMRGSTAEQGAARRARMIRYMTEGYRIATPEQRKHASAEMQDLVDDLREALR